MVEFPACRSLSVDVSPDGWMGVDVRLNEIIELITESTMN